MTVDNMSFLVALKQKPHPSDVGSEVVYEKRPCDGLKHGKNMKLKNLITGVCALCCGIAAAAPLTKYTVTRPETVRVQNAVSLQSAERMLLGTSKHLAAAYP